MLPATFTLPGLGWEIRSYGLMLALALLLGWWITLSLGRKDRLPPGPLGTAYVLGAAAGLVGARVGWLLAQPGDTASGAELFALRGDELATFSGIMLALIVAGLHLMRRRVPVIAGFDVAAPGFAAGAIVERLGALMAGTGYGDVARDLPWAIRFPAGSPAYLEHQRALEGLLPPGAEQSLPVHPTQIYAMALAGATLAVALWLRRRRRYSGQVLMGTAIAYLVGRAFVEEWFRADAEPTVFGPLDAGQVSSLVLVAALAVVMRSRAKLAAVRPAAFRPWEGGRWSPAAARPAAARAGASGPTTAAKTATASSSRAAGAGKGKGGKHKRRKKR